MSISSISSSAPVYQPPQQDPVSQNFQQLAQALQSGDLSSAQAAYTTLTQNLPNKTADGASSQNTPFQQGLATIGTALQSGNLSGAQQALQTLQSQMKGAHHGHHHHHSQSQATGSASSPTSSGTVSALSASSPSVNLTA